MKRRLSRIRVTINDIAPGGFGVAHVMFENEKRAVFVPKSVPGDELEVDADFSTRPARAEIVSVVTASKHRVAPPCAFADACGGCDYMHIAPSFQAAFHVTHVAMALRDVTKLAPKFTSATERLGVRTRARLHLESKRDGTIRSGFYGDFSHDIVEVDTCIALHPALERARALLPSWLLGSNGKGEASLGLGAFVDGVERRAVVALTWSGAISNDAFMRMNASIQNGELAGAQVIESGATRAARIGDPTPWALGADGAPIELAPGGFSQATDSPELARVVVAFATRALEGRTAPRILELYAGAGNFTVALARLAERIGVEPRSSGVSGPKPPTAGVGRVTAVESSADACECARKNLRARQLSAKVVCADASVFTADQRPDLVVLDPPRTGAKDACTHLLKEPAKRIVYVSCDPETLARDAKILCTEYVIDDVHALECFPMTSHVETVVLFSRRKKS